MNQHVRPTGALRSGGPAAPRAAAWRPARVLAVALTMAVVGAGTWLLGSGADHPAAPPRPAGTGAPPPVGPAPPRRREPPTPARPRPAAPPGRRTACVRRPPGCTEAGRRPIRS